MLLNKWQLKGLLEKKASVKKVLIVTLSNIGDVVLTLPCMDAIKTQFPTAKMTICVGPKAASLFKGNPNIEDVIIFDKNQSFGETWKLIGALRERHFDLAVNLRNSWLPIFAGAKCVTLFIDIKNKEIHMKDHHLKKIEMFIPRDHHRLCGIYVPDETKKRVDHLLGGTKKIMVIAPGAAAMGKRWTAKSFARLAQQLYDAYGLDVVLVGDQSDQVIAKEIVGQMSYQPINCCGQTSLLELAEIISRSALVVANDSGAMHLASYLNAPVIAMFGKESRPKQYGPWSNQSLCFSQMEVTQPNEVFLSSRVDKNWDKLLA